MRLVAICEAKDEAPIIGTTVDHLWSQGADLVVVVDGHSSDGTFNIAVEHGATVLVEESEVWDQSGRMSKLVATYAEPGDWVIPFDADEFWCSRFGTLAGTLADVPAEATKSWAQMYVHRDWDTRAARPKPLAKVAFRYAYGAIVADGDHNVTVPGGDVWGELEIREWQYRSWEHFLAKVARARRTYEMSPIMDPQSGAHMRRLCAMNRAQLEEEWARLEAGEWGGWVEDPIPTLVPAP